MTLQQAVNGRGGAQGMSFAQELHQAHKARIARMAGAAAKVAEPKPAEIRRVAVKQSWPMPKAVRPIPVAPTRVSPPRDYLNVASETNGPLAWMRIVAEVAFKHQVTYPELRGNQRSHTIVCARHELFYRLKRETTMSLPDIGRKLGGFDHTTVRYGAIRHEQRIAEGRAW